MQKIALFYTSVERISQLDLKLPSGWGGRRPGAGRKPRPRPAIRHRSRAPLASRHPCHVTLKVRPDVPSLRTVRLVREVERTFSRGCERGEFRLVHYSLQGDHAHLLVEARDREAMGRGMKSLAARFSRAVNRVFRRSGAVLADRYHLRVLRSPLEVRRALAYVLLNGRRHTKRPKPGAVSDPASSGRWFDGWSRKPRVRLAHAPPANPAVAAPHTWLLRVGWRRHGLLDPDAVPGRRGAG
jgi:putative transposase